MLKFKMFGRHCDRFESTMLHTVRQTDTAAARTMLSNMFRYVYFSLSYELYIFVRDYSNLFTFKLKYIFKVYVLRGAYMQRAAGTPPTYSRSIYFPHRVKHAPG